MLSDERKIRLLALIRERKNVSVAELRDILQVSESTIRRDMAELEARGDIRRVFGGAMDIPQVPDDSDTGEEDLDAAARQGRLAIARAAAELVQPGDRVYFDSGRTVADLILFLREKDAEYITNSLSAASRLSLAGFRACLIGGEINEAGTVTVGADAILGVQKYRFTIGFFGAGGVTTSMGFTTADVREGLVRRTAVNMTNSSRRFFLIGQEKFGVSRTVTFASLGNGIIFTDGEAPAEIAQRSEVRVISL